LLEAYKKEIDTEKKEKILNLITEDKSMDIIKKNIDHIYESFSFFDIKLKSPL
jgi:hypothetical protein